jgi:hypothetical protein
MSGLCLFLWFSGMPRGKSNNNWVHPPNKSLHDAEKAPVFAAIMNSSSNYAQKFA